MPENLRSAQNLGLLQLLLAFSLLTVVRRKTGREGVEPPELRSRWSLVPSFNSTGVFATHELFVAKYGPGGS